MTPVVLQAPSVNVQQTMPTGWLNPSPLGEVKVRHAGENRHPGSFADQVQKSPGFRLPPE